MPLESCMLVLDNSEYMRNGDLLPTRFEAQAQAVSTVFSAKTDSNPESAVGLMTMAGKSPSLLVTPTNDIGKLLSALGKALIGGLSDLQTAIQVAQLALKHRENKNQRQRIVVFVGSPLEDTQENLVKLGKKLRKNNVLIDVVTFGEEGISNDEKLNALVEAAGGGESHLVSIPQTQALLADMIASSPILFDADLAAATGAGGGGGGDMDENGIDPNMDPELAMAIRMSLAEANAGQASSSAAASTSQPAEASDSSSSVQMPSTLTAPVSNANEGLTAVPPASGDQSSDMIDLEGEGEDEDEELRRAIAMSRGENPDDDVVMADDGEEDEEDEEAAMARAIQMSLEEGKDQKDGK